MYSYTRTTCTHTHTYFKRYIVSGQFVQHVVSQPGHHSLSGFPGTRSTVFRLNTEDGVQDVFGQFALVRYVCVGVKTKYFWSIIGWKTLLG